MTLGSRWTAAVFVTPGRVYPTGRSGVVREALPYQSKNVITVIAHKKSAAERDCPCRRKNTHDRKDRDRSHRGPPRDRGRTSSAVDWSVTSRRRRLSQRRSPAHACRGRDVAMRPDAAPAFRAWLFKDGDARTHQRKESPMMLFANEKILLGYAAIVGDGAFVGEGRLSDLTRVNGPEPENTGNPGQPRADVDQVRPRFLRTGRPN
jgi:hypothetical protein